MSVLAQEVYKYLEKTGNRSTKSWLRTKFGVGSIAITKALEELNDKLHNVVDCGGRVYFVPTSQAEAREALQAPSFVMKPYVPPAALIDRKREIEAQRAEFPSRFD